METSAQELSSQLDHLTVQPAQGQSRPLNKKRSERFTVHRVTEDPPAVPNTPSAGFNPAVGSMPTSSFGVPPSAELPNLNMPSQAQTTPQPFLLPGQEESSDEIIPTALVFKNISFQSSESEMLELMDTLGLARPHAFNFHFDQPASPNGQGQFRGLAFANFFEPDQATAALTALNGYDIHGRKLRVEYKRQLRAGEKEKIEMAKALKRIRSASQLRGERSPEDYPALHQMPPPPSQHYGYGVQPPFSQQMGYNLMPDRYSPSVPNHALASPNVLSSSSASDADVSSSQYYSTTDTGNSTSTSPTLQQKPITQRRQASAVKTELDMNDAQTLEIYSRVLLFKDDTMRDELAFSRSLSAHQRRVVHLVAQKLGMEHASVGEGTERHAVVYKPGALPENMETKTVRSHRSSNNLRKKSMPNMRSSNETQGVPPMGSLGLGGAGGRMLAGRKSQGDLRPKSSGQAPPPPPPVPSQAALLDPNNSPTGTASSSGSNPASCGPKSGTTRAARSASAAGTKGRAEQSRDWRVPAAAPAPSDFERPSAQTVEALQL